MELLSQQDSIPRPVVLLVDDEPVVRNMVQAALSNYGFTVISAASGQEGLELASKFDGHIDLLLSDVKMPGMTGPELAECLVCVRPHIKVLLMSGEVSGALPKHFRLQVLQKPFLASGLLNRINNVLSPARSAGSD